VILGLPTGSCAGLPDVDSLFRAYLPWREIQGVRTTTFERLVGPRGGGSPGDQRDEVRGILGHIGFPLRGRLAVDAISRRVFSPESPTFRSGQVGGWRRYFKPEHVAAFKQVAGQLLIDLGYERDLAW
jgi:sulfotransferase 6B1